MDVVDSVGGHSFEIHEDAPRKSGACVMEAEIEDSKSTGWRAEL